MLACNQTTVGACIAPSTWFQKNDASRRATACRGDARMGSISPASSSCAIATRDLASPGSIDPVTRPPCSASNEITNYIMELRHPRTIRGKYRYRDSLAADWRGARDWEKCFFGVAVGLLEKSAPVFRAGAENEMTVVEYAPPGKSGSSLASIELRDRTRPIVEGHITIGRFAKHRLHCRRAKAIGQPIVPHGVLAKSGDQPTVANEADRAVTIHCEPLDGLGGVTLRQGRRRRMCRVT